MPEDSPVCSTIIAAQAGGLPAAAIDRLVWERHGTTRTILALDSSGMTRMTRAHGIVHFLSCYLRMRAVAQAALERQGCLAWRSFADNMFAEFRTTDAALDAALEIHRALQERKITFADGEPYRVCIAIGHGRVLDNGRFGVLGDEMNIVAKLGEDIAAPGETLLTQAGFENLKSHPHLSVEKVELTVSKVAVTCYRVLA